MGRGLPASNHESLESPSFKERGGHVLLGSARSRTGRHSHSQARDKSTKRQESLPGPQGR